MKVFGGFVVYRRDGPHLVAAIVLAGIVLAAACIFGVFPRAKDVAFKPVRAAPPFPPITEFPIKPVREAPTALNPSELVLGVTVDKDSRAYPINMLTGAHREILNDELGGKAIAATW